MGQLVSRSESELLSIRNLGQKSVGEIEQRLGDLGLSLARQAEPGRAGSSPESRPGRRSRRARPGAAGCQRHGATGQRRAGRPAAADGATANACGREPCDRERATANGTPDGNAAWDGSRPAAWTGDEDAGLRRDEPEDDALNLFDVAAGPILKRALPAAAVTVLLIWAGTRIRRRGRRRASSA